MANINNNLNSNREHSVTLSAAYRAATSSPSTRDIETLCLFWRETRNRPMDIRGNTILHFLAVYGNVGAIRVFLRERLVSIEELAVKNAEGDTPLHKAARFGQKEVANDMLCLDMNLALASNNLGESPIYVSAAFGANEVFFMLARYDPSESTLKRSFDGCTILHAAITHEHYDLAMEILKLFPQLARTPNGNGTTPLNVLATKQHSFRSSSPYRFDDLGIMPLFFWQLLETIIYCCIPALYEVSKQDNSNVVITKRKRSPFINCILRNGWLEAINDAKQSHILSGMLARRLIELDDWNNYQVRGAENPLIQATKHGITELVKEILETHPEAAETWDENGSNILHIAATVKNRFVYDYLVENVVNKDTMLSDIDSQGNTVIHYAAKRGGRKTFPYGPLKQMSWAVLWFKRVQYCTHPTLWNWKNRDGKTATQVFEEDHSTLQNEAEFTIRDLANYGLILATLLATINFAAVFTLPGGFDQNNGLPIFLNTQHLHLWRIQFFLGAALFASVFNIAALLGILNTKFDFDDFYIGLPLKYLIVLVAMFFATAFTVLACAQALFLEKMAGDNGSWYIILGVSVVIMTSLIAHVEVSGPFYPHGVYVVRHLFSYKSQFTK